MTFDEDFYTEEYMTGLESQESEDEVLPRVGVAVDTSLKEKSAAIKDFDVDDASLQTDAVPQADAVPQVEASFDTDFYTDDLGVVSTGEQITPPLAMRPSASVSQRESEQQEASQESDSLTAAAFRLYNTPTSVVRYGLRKAEGLFETEEFDLQKTLNADDIPQEERIHYAGCNTYADYKVEKQRQADIKLLDNAGFFEKLIPTLVAGAADPANWIAVGGAVRASMWTGKIVNAVVSASAGATARYATQTGMTKEDVAMETIAAGMVTGVIGGVVKSGAWLKDKKIVKEATEATADFLKGACDDAVFAVKGTEIYQNIAGKTVELNAFTKQLIKSCPYLRGVTDDCETFRDMTTRILRSNQIITAETRAGKVQSQSIQSDLIFNQNETLGIEKKYNSFYKSAFEQSGTTPQEFNKSVYRILDGHELPSLGDPASDAAKLLSDAMQGKIDKSAEVGFKGLDISKSIKGTGKTLTAAEAKLSEEEIKTLATNELLSETKEVASRYFPRKYIPEAVLENQKEFERLLRLSELKNNPLLSEAELIKRVKEITQHAIGESGVSHDAGQHIFDVSQMFKKRTVSIHDELLEPFLLDNPLEVYRSFSHKVTLATSQRRILLEKSKELGVEKPFKSWNEFFEWYEHDRTAKMDVNLNAEAKNAYMAATKEKVDYMKTTIDVVTGSYKQYAFSSPTTKKVVEGLMAWNFVRKLGSVLISSFADITAPVCRFGFGRTLKAAIGEFGEGSLSKQQGWNQILHATEEAMGSARIFGDTYKLTPQRGVIDKVAKFFGKTTGLPYWNDYWKRVVANLHYEDVLNAVMNPTEKGNLFLKQQRITDAHKDIIRKAYEKFGYKSNDCYVLPLNRIENNSVREALFNTIHTQCEETIVTIGAGDVPHFLRSDVGKALFQFRSFSMAYFNKIIMPQVLQKESRTHTGAYLLSSAVVAPLVTCLAQWNRGKDVDVTSGEFWKEAMAKATILGPYQDALELIEGVHGDIERGRTERMFTRASPMLGLAADVANLFRADMTNQKRRAIVSMIPWNNYLGINRIVRQYLQTQTKKSSAPKKREWQ